MKPRRPAWWRDPGPSVWGEEDWFKYGMHPDTYRDLGRLYQPINETLMPPPPDRSLEGFTLFPARKSKRAADADAALQKLGLR